MTEPKMEPLGYTSETEIERVKLCRPGMAQCWIGPDPQRIAAQRERPVLLLTADQIREAVERVRFEYHTTRGDCAQGFADEALDALLRELGMDNDPPNV